MPLWGRNRDDSKKASLESDSDDDNDVDKKEFVLIDGMLTNPDADEDEDDTDESASYYSSEDENEQEEEQYGDAPGKDPRCTLSYYETKGKIDEGTLLDSIGPNEDGGLVYSIHILNQEEDMQPIKPRRKAPFPITLKDFESSVTRVGKPSFKRLVEEGFDELWDRDSRMQTETSDNIDEARWIFSGVLNGWPGLRTLEVLKVEYHDGKSIFNKNRKTGWKTLWSVGKEGEVGTEPSNMIKELWSNSKSSPKIRASLRAPNWTSKGWSKESPGFIYWVEGQCVQNYDDTATPPLTVTYGTNLLPHFQKKTGGDPLCKRIHMISFRYALGEGKKEKAKDFLTYHSFVLMEWDHEQFCTIAEIAWLNGVSGNNGKAAYYHDRDVKPFSQLYAALPPEMVSPWKSSMSEIRLHDVPFKNVDTFITNFMRPYEGPSGRFVDIQHSFYNEVRLTYNSRSNMCTYLLNYIRRDRTYNEMKRNCQTFAADLCGFLAGKKDVEPFALVNKVKYVNHNHYFLYEGSKYKSKKEKKRK